MGSQAATALQASRDQVWWVVCFCAQWCGVCREFRAAFDTLAREQPTLHTAWVDVEDEEDIVGDLDVETFPTILVAGQGRVRFFGPVLPQAPVLTRMVASLQAGEGGAGADAAAQALLQRVLDSR
ncbi:MAG TPA: thiol reductase thioredoxin [Comamonadaceae bacterium]|uniref:thioredoxin family protein n=1 Tax=Pulveribacter sp. TaxID=2678893 RepID=UPI000EC9A8CD|nr:thioredoxin family protein [Pulveribacter sp.]HCL86910.1 thiol reductase thioredoxin [Comamonadaceae bacterium]